MSACVVMVWRDRRRRRRGPRGELVGLKLWRSEPCDYDRALTLARGMTTRHTIVWLERPGQPATQLQPER